VPAPTFEDARRLPGNRTVVERIETLSAHSDVAEVLFVYGRERGYHVVLIEPGADYPAVVALRDDATIVGVAYGMSELVLHVSEPPGSRLPHRRDPDLGPGWWRVAPWNVDVSIPDTQLELRHWFSAIG
jgi:hypothetical protein